MWIKSFLIFLNYFLLIDAYIIERADISKCGYEGCPEPIDGMLNVHLVLHTHDDLGWLKTMDQYYYGSRGRIQKASVQYIIDSVVEGLLQNPSRRFVYVESGFFAKWWNEQNEEKKNEVKMLVNEGRLEFLGGAWSMNDEATAHYQSIVDQFTWGLKFLNDTFGECGRPRVGWQIDPFGHSREQASLFTKMGYDGLFFARLDFRDKKKRLDEKSMEMIWKSSDNLDDNDIFTGALYNHYSPPPGFCYDVLCDDEPIIDDPESVAYNVDNRVTAFVNYVKTQATRFRSNNVMLTMGDDFHFLSANLWFKNLDKLIKYTNERSNELKVNVLYSSASCYLKAIHQADVALPTKNDDFFPYASDSHAYWTGYFTSRPTSKRFERVGNHFMQICKQLSSTAKTPEIQYNKNLDKLRRIMGVMQHHDAVTGTERQHVADDYHRELDASIKACELNTQSSLNQFTTGKKPTSDTQWEFGFNSCLNLNISICEIPEKSKKFMVTVYNPLAHKTNQFVRFPIDDAKYEIRDSRNMIMESQLIPIPMPLKNLPYRTNSAFNELVFQASNVPAVGYANYFVTRVTNSKAYNDIQSQLTEPVVIGSADFGVTFDIKGFLSEITIDGVKSSLIQKFVIYKGASGNNQGANRSSGAYIFRPDPNKDEEIVGQEIGLEVFRGDLVDEVHQVFNNWISQVVRIYKKEKLVEFEWLVGPIPIDDSVGREIVSRFETEIKNNGVFYTDSNGREMIKRNAKNSWDIDDDEPITSKYYPINTKIAIEDENNRLAILNDRAQGGSSQKDGSVELMLHRRLLHDDAFGVAEALNETAYGDGLIARGKHWLVFGKKSSQNPTLAGQERLLQNRVHLPNWLFFNEIPDSMNSDEWSNKYTNLISGIGSELPENIHLMTFEPWNDSSFLVRFEHILEKNEDPELSKPVSFNLTHVLPGNFVFSEVVLSANQWIEDMDRLHFKKEGGESKVETPKTKATEIRKFVTEITLKPMEFKTFIMSPPYDIDGGAKSQIISRILIIFVAIKAVFSFV